MGKPRLLPITIFILATVFLLSVLWEFYLEELLLLRFVPDHELETDSGRWEYVFTSLIFAMISLLIPVWLLGRQSRKRESAFSEVSMAEERLRSIIETAREGIWIIDDQAKTTFVNLRMAEILGYEPAEMLGRTMYEFMDDSACLEAERNFARRREGVTEQHDFRFRHKDGSDVWTIIETNPIQDRLGGFTGAVGMITDITERRMIEEEVRLSGEKYRTLFDSMLDGYALHEIICDEKGNPRDYRFLEINNAFEALTGLGKEIIGKTALEVIPKIEPFWIETYGQVALTGKPARFENYSRGLGGNWFEVVSFSPVKGQFVAVFRDVTKRVWSEKALHESKEAEKEARTKLEYAIENMPAAFMLFDAEEKLVHHNRIMREYFPEHAAAGVLTPGHSFEEFIRVSAPMFANESEESPEEWARRRLAEFRSDSPPEQEFKSADGRWFRGFDRKTPEGWTVCIRMDVTGRKKVEEELRESREALEKAHSLLVDAVEALPTSFALYDDQDRLVICNKKTHELFPDFLPVLRPGVKYEEIARFGLEHDLIKLTREQKEALARNPALEHSKHPELIEQELSDGRCFEIYHRPTSDGGTVTTRMEVTWRKQAEEKLRKSEEKYRTLIEATRQGIFVHRDYRILFANDALVKILGYESLDDLTAVDLRDLCSPEERSSIESTVESIMKGEIQPQYFESRLIRKDCSPVWTKIMAIKVLWEGAPAVLAVINDLTEQRRAEEALRERDELIKLAMEGTDEGFWDWDMKTGSIKFDENWPTVLGYQPGEREFDMEWIGSNLPPESLPEFEKALEDYLEGRKKYYEIEYQIRTKSGAWKWIWSRGKVIEYDGKMKPLRMIGTLRDITEAKYLKNQLLQAQKMEALGTLIAGVVHEINNPNSFIMLNAPILSEIWKNVLPLLRQSEKDLSDIPVGNISLDEIVERIPGLLSGIQEGSERIQQIVANLKEFARVDSAAMNEVVDLNTIIRSTILLTKGYINKATKRFEVELAPDLPTIKGNTMRVQQVVINLLLNSCEALNDIQKGITVQSAWEEEKGQVVLQVRDEGSGIPQEDLERIKDPFFTTKRDSGGTGLGLSISDSIIRDHGGSLVFESTPGEGTTATVNFPLYSISDE